MNPKVTIYHADHMAKWSTPWLNAIKQGFLKHGINPSNSTYTGARHGIDCDLAVFWSHRPKHIIEHQKKHGLDYLVIERGYIGDRTIFSSVGFNGLNNRGEYYADGMPGDRWTKYFDGMIKPWREFGKYILLIGQVDGDESIRGRIKMNNWLHETVQALNKHFPDTEVVFRPHPLSRQNHKIQGTSKSRGDLEKDLSKARLCVTYNSNTGVESVLAGVPTITMDRGAMAYDITPHSLFNWSMIPQRTQWAYDMAYKQWTVEEAAEGKAWNHLKRKYD